MKIQEMCVVQALVYKHTNVFCQIHVEPRSLKYFHGQKKRHITHRWMQTEHWAQFDARLESLLNENVFQDAKAREVLVEKRFKVNDNILVLVRNSNTSTELLRQCLGMERGGEDNCALTLHCSIKLSNDLKCAQEVSLYKDLFSQKNASPKHPEYVPAAAPPSTSTVNYSHAYMSYTPSPKKESQAFTTKSNVMNNKEVESCPPKRDYSVSASSQSPQATEDVKNGMKVKEDIKNSYLEPYLPQPSVKSSAQSNSATVKSQVDEFDSVEPYSPKPLREQCGKSESTSDIPQYYPIRIQNKQKPCTNGADEHKMQSNYEKKKKLKRKREYLSKTDDLPVGKVDSINDEMKIKKQSKTSELRSKTQDTNVELRRSQRAPIQKRDNSNKMTKKSTALNKIQEDLFGSEDDDTEDSYPPSKEVVNEVDQTGVKKGEYEGKKNRLRSSASVDKNKRQPVGSYQVLSKEAPSRMNTDSNIQKSMEKKTLAPNPEYMKTSDCTSEEVTIRNYRFSSKQNTNLEKFVRSAPDKVKIYSLDMTSSAMLETFKEHKNILDAVFNEVKNTIIESHNGVDHYLVMGVSNDAIQFDMMTHLNNIYRPNYEGSTFSLVSILTNVLLPEWIVCICMNEFRMTRKETIEQLKAQERYKLQLVAESDVTLNFH